MAPDASELVPLSEVFERLGRSSLFKDLPRGVRRSLGRRAEVRAVRAGEVIIREGEIGRALYLVVEGSVRVTVERGSAEPGAEGGTVPWPVPVARLTRGDHFGEQALLHDEPAPRTATVRAIDDGVLLQIPAAAFRQAIEFDQSLRDVLEREGRAYVLNRMRRQTRALRSIESRLASARYERRSFVDRQIVFRQDQPADCAYVLVSGTVVVKFLDEQRQVTSLVELAAPRLFGERGILERAPRSGTAVAVGDVEVVVIPGDELLAIHRSSPELRQLCRSLQNVYDIPGVGHATHYRGTFMDLPAHCVLLRRDGGSEYVAYKAVHSEIFAVTRTGSGEPVVVRHEAEERTRELCIDDGTLVGVTSYGHWSDSEQLTEAVMQGVRIGEADLERFARDGTIPRVLERLPEADPEILCRCMRVSTSTVAILAASGVRELPVVMQRCGAGTICGGCRPRIEQLLGHRAWTPCRMEAPVEHTASIWSFRLVPAVGTPRPFVPGQHIVVQAEIDGRAIQRSYTLTSTPRDPYYEITIKREPRGLFSGWMFEHGRRRPAVEVSAPQGEFVVQGRDEGSILLFGGGIGITPALGFLRACVDGSAESHAGRPILLDYSTRTAEDAVGDDVFDAATAVLPNFRCRHRVTSVDGRITRSAVVGLLREYRRPAVFICGPKPYETSLRAMLQECGVPPEDVHVEEFTSVGASPETDA